MECLGRNLDMHCCWTGGIACEFLEENTEPGFRWTCGLRRELGDWDKVLADPRYLNGPGAFLGPKDINCKDWPDETKGQRCKGCGVNV